MVRLVWLAVAAPIWGARVAVHHELEAEDDALTIIEDVNDVDRVLLQNASQPGLARQNLMLKAKRYLSLGWYPDGSELNFFGQSKLTQLFDLEDGDIETIEVPSAWSWYIEGESLEEMSNIISEELGLPENSGSLSGAVSTMVTRSSSPSHRQMVSILRTRAVLGKVASNVMFPERRLRSAVVQFIQERPAQDIIDSLGQFYATQITLGGVIQAKFQQTQTMSDSYSTFATDVLGNADSLSEKAEAVAGVSVENSATGGSESLHVEVQVQGGDRGMILRSGDWLSNMKDWSTTIVDHPYSVSMDMSPLWEVIKQVDQDKGEEVERLLLAQWNRERIALRRLDQLPKVSEI